MIGANWAGSLLTHGPCCFRLTLSKVKLQQMVQSDKNGRRHLQEKNKYIHRAIEIRGPASRQWTSTTSSGLPVGVLCKTVSCLLFKSPLVTWFSFVLHYLRTVIHLQRARTDSPLYKVEENDLHWSRTELIPLNTLLVKVTKDYGTVPAELIFELNSSWKILDARSLSHASTCWNTVFYCTWCPLLPRTLHDDGGGIK